MIPNKQIGWSNESNLLWEISRQLDRINSFMCTGDCPTTTTTTTTVATSSITLTIVNNSSINHGAYASTFYVIYNGDSTAPISGASLNSGDTMVFERTTNLDSNNVLQLYSNNGLLPFYIDSVVDSVTSAPITYTDITGNGFNSPYVNGITIDATIATNGITINLIDQP